MSRAGKMPRVSLLATSGEDLEVHLGPGVNRVGRQPEGNTLVLTSPSVSRYHAEIEVTGGGVLLRDLGSANGTFLNSERVGNAHLHDGDLVGFSDVFTFKVAMREDRPGAAPLIPLPPPRPSRMTAVAPTVSAQPLLPADGLEMMEGDGFQLVAIMEFVEAASRIGSRRELERPMLQCLDGLLTCQRGFITYRRVKGDWKLIMVGQAHAWDRREVGRLLRRAKDEARAVWVRDSRQDIQLGNADTGQGDARVLVPLSDGNREFGAAFLVAPEPESLDKRTVRLLERFAGVAVGAMSRFGGG